MNRIARTFMFFFVINLVSILCIPLSFSAENKASTAPKISPVELQYDFGQAREGQNVEHIFKIRNTGGRDLVIHKAKGS